MKSFKDILWFILIGLWEAIGMFVSGVILCVTVIGIPFGIQYIKMAKTFAFPFEVSVDVDFGSHPVLNTIWLIISGAYLWLGYILFGVVLCITLIGIPFGLQCFKLAKYAALPFGANVG